MNSNIAIEIAEVNAAPFNTRSWKEFADLINGAWHKGAPAFIQTGKYLLGAKAELDHRQFNGLVQFKLDFDRSVAAKLMRIAANGILCAHVRNLPPCWSTLYELSKLADDVLSAAIVVGRILPKMQRKDPIALRKPPKTDLPQSRSKSSFAAARDVASTEEIVAVGRIGLGQVLSEALERRDAILAQTIQTASTSSFAVKATNHLHCALRCAEQRSASEQNVKTMMGALHCIGRDAAPAASPCAWLAC